MWTFFPHGSFSLIFHKEFYTINATNDSRTKDLLAKLEVDNRDVDSSNINSFERRELNYSVIAKKLDAVRKSSIDFLNFENI